MFDDQCPDDVIAGRLPSILGVESYADFTERFTVVIVFGRTGRLLRPVLLAFLSSILHRSTRHDDNCGQKEQNTCELNVPKKPHVNNEILF